MKTIMLQSNLIMFVDGVKSSKKHCASKQTQNRGIYKLPQLWTENHVPLVIYQRKGNLMQRYYQIPKYFLIGS